MSSLKLYQTDFIFIFLIVALVCTPVSVFLFVCFLGGFVFAKPLRDKKCVTMMDPFHRKYGKGFTAIMCLASVCLDVMWMATILIGLGKRLKKTTHFATTHNALSADYAAHSSARKTDLKQD